MESSFRMRPELEKIALEMRRNAAEIDILNENPMGIESRNKVKDSRRVFDYKGHKIVATLTIDTLQNRWAWHLSLCEGSGAYPQKLPDEIVKEIVKVMLPDSVEVPSFLHPGKLRQFLKIVSD